MRPRSRAVRRMASAAVLCEVDRLRVERDRFFEALERIAGGFEASTVEGERDFMKQVASAALQPPFEVPA